MAKIKDAEEVIKVDRYNDHTLQLKSLNRISGQLDGIKKMIENKSYCIDLLIQLKAVRNAIKSVETNVLQKHTTECINKAISSNDKEEINTKTAELFGLIKKYME